MPKGIPKNGINKGWFKRGNKGFWLGKKRLNMSGANHPNWKGEKLKKTCIVCEKKYLVQRYRIKSKFCSHACRAKYYFTGDKNCNWKGGTSWKKHKFRSSEMYQKWHEKVLRRDEWTCKLCGLRGNRKNKIIAHHIIPMEINPKLSLKVGNGITLCIKCHRLTYGKELQFAKVFKEILRDYTPNIPKG